MRLRESMKGVEIQEEIEQRLADTSWELEDGFSEYVAIGSAGDLSILLNLRSWDGNNPVYELYDVGRHLSYRVKEIPTPEQAATLLQEHGGTPEEA
jgi:hypothetical protein